MKRRPWLWLAASGCLAGGLIGAVPAAAAAPAYTMTDLGSLGRGVSSGYAINAAGEVVGQSYLAKKITVSPCPTGGPSCKVIPGDPFGWVAGTMTDLGTLGHGAYDSSAVAVNRAGEVVGYSSGNAFLFRQGKISQLGPEGFTATGINDTGAVSGYFNGHAYLLSGGKLTQLPNLSGGDSYTIGINNLGQMAGNADLANTDTHAVIWHNGTITDLGTLGGPDSTATAINDLGQVTGTSLNAAGRLDTFLYTSGKMTDLGDFGGNEFTPAAINNHDVIVGGDLVWSNGVFRNLNTLVPPGSPFSLYQATAINDNGQIVANGVNAQGTVHAFLLTPS